jgi:hypothetical protein
MLARLLRAGELTAVWVPDAGHEAMRDLVSRHRFGQVEQTASFERGIIGNDGPLFC